MLVECFLSGGAELLAQEQLIGKKSKNLEPSLFQDLVVGGKGLN